VRIQTGDLDAITKDLQLASVVLVAHDASGPPVIDSALDHPHAARDVEVGVGVEVDQPDPLGW
jgi:hypothetical protein